MNEPCSLSIDSFPESMFVVSGDENCGEAKPANRIFLHGVCSSNVFNRFWRGEAATLAGGFP